MATQEQTITIKGTTYKVIGSKVTGERRFTGLMGARGAEKTLIECAGILRLINHGSTGRNASTELLPSDIS